MDDYANIEEVYGDSGFYGRFDDEQCSCDFEGDYWIEQTVSRKMQLRQRWVRRSKILT